MEVMKIMPAMISPPRRFPYRGSAGEVMAGGAGANEREKARGGCPHTRRGRCEHRRRRCCAYLRFHNRAKRAVKRGFSVKYGLFCACLRYQALSTYFILVIPVQYITLLLPELRSGINRAGRHTQARGAGAAVPHRAPCNMRSGVSGGPEHWRPSDRRSTWKSGFGMSRNWGIPPVGLAPSIHGLRRAPRFVWCQPSPSELCSPCQIRTCSDSGCSASR